MIDLPLRQWKTSKDSIIGTTVIVDAYCETLWITRVVFIGGFYDS